MCVPQRRHFRYSRCARLDRTIQRLLWSISPRAAPLQGLLEIYLVYLLVQKLYHRAL
jgi:hypothetical protein